ncbi:hypothetical protein [Streptomyces sp. NPDC001194]|uniref:hypothetical protein n=1 Tax=Streptomyces sp. NPDC001194 TaxID=3364547 RepID=UPI0036C4E844
MKLLTPMTGPLMAQADEGGRAKVCRALTSLLGDRARRVRVTPVMWDVDGSPQMKRVVLLLDGLGREIPTPRGGHHEVVRILWLGLPKQWLDTACEYDVSSGELHRYDPPIPCFLRQVA